MGPTTIQVGGHYLYVGVLDKFENDHGHTVSIDNIIGNSKITSAVKDDETTTRRSARATLFRTCPRTAPSTLTTTLSRTWPLPSRRTARPARGWTSLPRR